ncbi:hypothetical protein COCC4DRAFT_139778 [Bipolaris maydis ATCC 48331]|uniref:Uncharacterized protein n=2 Tax=Cochliobolus heterostrophus TaxID=5016 RepID=M2U308_COCH5|nr:uncharacterized protein COCC4DRAFT_139778 [Bipolaris maydis ATCC 48331]EMD92909.1 hypothetical protein COCHEDRAFT_15947 [Bipolaris maydis C5]ENI04705.1 hypothetical protein COCC4DRAFT_139778 [Bipolaris maydis ATCC 48331]
MVLNLTSSDPRNAESVALRNKQKAELEKFQKGVEAAKAEFFKDIEKKREELLIKHKHEKRDLVNKEQANRSGTALPKESGDRPRQTPANTSKASPYAKTDLRHPSIQQKPQNLDAEKMCGHSHHLTRKSNRELAPLL